MEKEKGRIKFKWDEDETKGGNYQIDGIDFSYPDRDNIWERLEFSDSFGDDLNKVIKGIDPDGKLPANVKMQIMGLIATMLEELERLHDRIDNLRGEFKSHSHVRREVDFVEVDKK